jgi:hypothetical protein
MLQVTRVYKLNNKITSTFNMLHQNAILTAAQRNKTYAVFGLPKFGKLMSAALSDVTPKYLRQTK